MDTTHYFYAAYGVFWLLPVFFLFRLSRRTRELERRLDDLKPRINDGAEPRRGKD